MLKPYQTMDNVFFDEVEAIFDYMRSLTVYTHTHTHTHTHTLTYTHSHTHTLATTPLPGLQGLNDE